jgi:hypothetical protein
MSDDFAPPPDKWSPTESQWVGFVTATEIETGEIVGLAMVGAHNAICWEVHNAIPGHIGWKKRIAIGKEFLDWLWSCGCKRVMGRVLAGNRYALRYNEALGLEVFGVNKKCFKKNNALCDEIWLGISSPDTEVTTL